jgi:hypothetical protein
MPSTDLPPLKLRWFFWTTLGLLLFVIIGYYSVRMTQNYTSFDDKRASTRYETLQKLRADEQKALTTADWVDQGKKIVRIPIDEAMAEEIDVLKAKPAVMGCPIPVLNAAPAASTSNAAPAAATSNAPAAATSSNAKPTP